MQNNAHLQVSEILADCYTAIATNVKMHTSLIAVYYQHFSLDYTNFFVDVIYELQTLVR